MKDELAENKLAENKLYEDLKKQLGHVEMIEFLNAVEAAKSDTTLQLMRGKDVLFNKYVEMVKYRIIDERRRVDG